MAASDTKAVSYLTGRKTLHIAVPDGRFFTGTFKCTDCDCNVVLSNAFEYSQPSAKAQALAKERSQLTGDPARANMTSRFLGLIVVPKHQITSIGLEEQRVNHLIGYAMKIVNDNPERSLAVFSILDVEEDLKFRFGKRGKLYLVPTICKRYELYDLPGRYTGRGEWLAWGDIKCDPVIIFNRGSVLELHQTLSSMGGLNRSTGEELGKLLRDVDREYKGVLARSLVKSFRVTGCDFHYNQPIWLEFADALYSADSSNRELSVITTLCGGLSVDGDEEEIHDEADIWTEFSEPLGMDRNESNMMEEALKMLRRQGKDILREAQATTTATTTRADVTVLEGLHDWVDVAPMPPTLSSSHAINFPASPPALSTRARSIIDLTAETAEYHSDSDSDDDSFFEVEMEVTSTPPRQRGEEQDDDDDDLVIIGCGHHQHQHQAMPRRSKSQSVVVISSQRAES
ncbi:hypothetical protein DV736_g4440, partial [Chaetothyriales sp. CBS 134916]